MSTSSLPLLIAYKNMKLFRSSYLSFRQKFPCCGHNTRCFFRRKRLDLPLELFSRYLNYCPLITLPFDRLYSTNNNSCNSSKLAKTDKKRTKQKRVNKRHKTNGNCQASLGYNKPELLKPIVALRYGAWRYAN